MSACVRVRDCCFRTLLNHSSIMFLCSFSLASRELAQVAWNFVNDSLFTTCCLKYAPKLIATAALYLASKYLKIELPKVPFVFGYFSLYLLVPLTRVCSPMIIWNGIKSVVLTNFLILKVVATLATIYFGQLATTL